MITNNLSGTILGQYELQELIGAGRMGAVYRAYQPNLHREVAVRILPASGYDKRFAYLAGIAASLEHPHIVRVFDYGIEQDMSYMVMQLMTGGALSERLAQQANSYLPSLGDISHVLQQISSALDYAHARGIIHRDINPSNVMFHDNGHVCLTDFGVAQLVQEASPITPGYSPGTWAYMSPEQWNDQRLTPAADQYSLAVLIYFLIAGRPPYSGSTPSAIMFKHLHEMPPPLPEIPDAVTAVLDRALSKDAEHRFPTVTAFTAAFDEAIGDQRSEVTEFFTAPFERKPVTVIAAQRPAPTYPRVPPVARTPIYKSPLLWVAAVTTVLIALLVGFIIPQMENKDRPVKSSAVGLIEISDLTETTTLPAEVPAGNDAGASPVLLASPTQTISIVPAAIATSTLAAALTNTPTVQPLFTSVPAAQPSTNTSIPAASVTPVPPTNTTIPTVQPSMTPVPPTNTPTIQPSPTALPTNTATLLPTNTAIPTVPPSATSIPPTNTPTVQPSPTAQPTNTATVPPTNTVIPTVRPSATSLPTNIPLPTRTLTPTTTPTPLLPALEPCDLADVNDDNQVDIFDIRAISAHYGTTSNEPTFEAHYDLDEDGVIGILDVQIAVAQFGAVCEP